MSGLELHSQLPHKPLFNPQGDTEVRLRRMIGGNTTNLNDFNNMKYPWVSDWYRQAMNNFWIPEEINLSQDVKDYPKRTGGCYVATCVYGSYDCPEVWTLRRYRDDVLAKSVLGRLFIRIYYAVSPKIVRKYGNNVLFRSYFKKKLDKKVVKLNDKGIHGNPYEDK